MTQLTGHAQNEFTWKDASNNTRNLSDLQEIVQKHEQWIYSEGKSGTRADLSRTNLSEANLSHLNLSEANLSHANLARANLSYTNLSRAKLDDANLDFASLIGAHFDGADLTNANLHGANLTNTHMKRANLANARLVYANLTNATLYNTNLTDADLVLANLARAKIRFRADLSGANVESGNFEGAVFEPNSLPDLSSMSLARNLELLTYENNPVALVQLRKQFEDGGFREQERKITYALKRRETELSWVGATSRELPGTRVRIQTPPNSLVVE